jgi:hypothetical protein
MSIMMWQVSRRNAQLGSVNHDVLASSEKREDEKKMR